MIRRIFDIASWIAIAAMCVAAVVVTAGLVVGFRPVAITTGSMDPWAPTGALVVAGPTDADDIEVGDVLIMEKSETVTVTHRVIELLRQRDQLLAVTQGDANDDPDPTTYLIDSSELTGRWAIPGAGRLLVAVNYRVVLLLVVTGALATLALIGLRWIWDDGDQGDDDNAGNDDGAPDEQTEALEQRRRSRRRASALPVATAVLTLLLADTSYALYTATETVSGNTFGTVDCLGAGGITVHRGGLSHGTNGSITASIPAVDPTKAFLLFSTRSKDESARHSLVRGELTDATTLTFYRTTTGPKIPKIGIEWSVVEYACGVTVQRGTAAGNGGTALDIPITAADPAASFALTTLDGEAADTVFSADDMVQAQVVSTSVLRLSSYDLDPATTYGWQVITFDEPGVASVQVASASLAAGTSSATITLPTAITPAATFLIAGVISNSTGGNIGEQMVSAGLTSATTIEVSRLVSTGSVDVTVQVVSLTDGTTVTHGFTDLGANKKNGTATLPGVDTSIATALSTVNLPASTSGGASAKTASAMVGEGSATFAVTSATSLSIKRDVGKEPARFGWQVIEWAK